LEQVKIGFQGIQQSFHIVCRGLVEDTAKGHKP